MKRHVISIDFETRSMVDIQACGAGRYAQDPSTRILCVCWAVDNGPIFGSLGEEVPAVFHQAVKEGWLFSAFNAMFEQLIWTYRWPALPRPDFECTSALCLAHGLPQKLERVCKALHLGWAKDIEGARLINLYSKPRKDGSFLELKGEDEDKMLAYCSKDVDLSRRIRQRLPELPPREQAVYAWTVKANLRGVQIDPGLATKAGEIAKVLVEQGNKELGGLTNGTILSVSQIERIKKYLLKHFAIETESLDKEAIGELLLRPGLPAVARNILELRRDLSQTSVKKFSRAAGGVCSDGRVRDALIYHGAATGRWTSQVVQFQNLPKHTLPDPETAFRLVQTGDADLWAMSYKSPLLALSGCIRGMVIPKPEHVLVVVDYAAIEDRTGMWLAGQEDALTSYREHKDAYLEMAEEIYQTRGLTKKDNPKERFVGKTARLGLIYGMGATKFRATCISYGQDIDAGLAERAVKAYRGKYRKVPELWGDLEEAARNCVRTGKAFTTHGLLFQRERDFLYLTLRSGRRLAYHHPGVDKDGLFYYAEDSGTYTYLKKHTWGGKLLENANQATARDILAEAVLRLEAAGYAVVLTVHDEVIVETPRAGAAKAKEDIIKIMCEVPHWAEGCPIGAEGFICDRYRKG